MEGILPLIALNVALIKTGMTPRQSKTIMSMLNASFLSGMGIGFLSIWYLFPYFEPSYLLTEPEETWIVDYIATYFTFDTILGMLFGDFGFLTGYIHHSAYIALCVYLRYVHHSNLAYLALPFEIPTVILDFHHVFPEYRYKTAFRVTFVLFRLLWNIYVMSLMYSFNTIYFNLTGLMLLTHSYWFALHIRKHFLQSPQDRT